jgi:inosine/xanthosine triphosphatase
MIIIYHIIVLISFNLNSTTAMSKIRIAVGSKNPVKLNSATNGFEQILNENASITVESFAYNVPSGVPDQPIGDDETLKGARNRATACFIEFKDDQGSDPDYAVGMEGGISDENGLMTCYAYITIYNGSKFGSAKTATFEIPKAIADLVRGGMELGDADDAVFNKINSKQGDGTVGQLTKGLISRTEYYIPAVILAYVKFNYPDLYGDD